MSRSILALTFTISMLYGESSMFLNYEKAITKESLKEPDNIFIKPKLLTKTAQPANINIVPKDNYIKQHEPIDTAATLITIKTDDESVEVATNEKPKTLTDSIKKAQQQLLSRAKEFLGTPYGMGSKGESKTDCSGFTQQVYSSFGVNLPRTASEQIHIGEKVDLQDLQVGDLLFYKTYKSDPSHVAIYAGEGRIIHASYSAKKVQYDSIDKDYYKNRFIGAKRIALNDTNE